MITKLTQLMLIVYVNLTNSRFSYKAKHFVNYEQSKGNYFTNADKDKIMDLSMDRGLFPLGYNHESFKTVTFCIILEK